MAQWVKDPALSLLWLRSQLWVQALPLENLCMSQIQPKKKKEGKKERKEKRKKEKKKEGKKERRKEGRKEMKSRG